MLTAEWSRVDMKIQNYEVKLFRASVGFSTLFGKSFWTNGGLNLIRKRTENGGNEMLCPNVYGLSY
jgi:hypothetical protein